LHTYLISNSFYTVTEFLEHSEIKWFTVPHVFYIFRLWFHYGSFIVYHIMLLCFVVASFMPICNLGLMKCECVCVCVCVCVYLLLQIKWSIPSFRKPYLLMMLALKGFSLSSLLFLRRYLCQLRTHKCKYNIIYFMT
jgi:hypothetical protein